MSQYLQILVALTTYAVSHPAAFAELWQAIVEAWHSAQNLAGVVVQQFQDATGAVPRAMEGEPIEGGSDVIEAEAKFEKALVALPTHPRASTRGIFSAGNGNFRLVLKQLLASPVGQVLLQQLLAKIGSAAS